MSAQTRIEDYVHSVNDPRLSYGSDNALADVMVHGGAVIRRTGGSRTFARIQRVGDDVVVTETTIAEHLVFHDDHWGEHVETRETVEVLRVSIYDQEAIHVRQQHPHHHPRRDDRGRPAHHRGAGSQR